MPPAGTARIFSDRQGAVQTIDRKGAEKGKSSVERIGRQDGREERETERAVGVFKSGDGRKMSGVNF